MWMRGYLGIFALVWDHFLAFISFLKEIMTSEVKDQYRSLYSTVMELIE